MTYVEILIICGDIIGGALKINKNLVYLKYYLQPNNLIMLSFPEYTKDSPNIG